MRILLTGGVKSGKSHRALDLAMAFPAPRYFLATATALDNEMQDKIAKHKYERGDRFITIEEPIEVHTFMRENMVLDCIPLWVNNILYSNQEEKLESLVSLLLARIPKNIVIVTNEVGLGIIPDNYLARHFCELLGTINIRLAAHMDSVEFMVAGKPLRVL